MKRNAAYQIGMSCMKKKTETNKQQRQKKTQKYKQTKTTTNDGKIKTVQWHFSDPRVMFRNAYGGLVVCWECIMWTPVQLTELDAMIFLCPKLDCFSLATHSTFVHLQKCHT